MSESERASPREASAVGAASGGSGSFHTSTLHDERLSSASLETLWQAWTAPAARRLWAAPRGEATVLEECDVGGPRNAVRQPEGEEELRCTHTWLSLRPASFSVSAATETVGGRFLSASLITATFSSDQTTSRVRLTVQRSAACGETDEGAASRLAAGLDALADVAARTMLIERVIPVSRERVWGAWMNETRLPTWWGPDGFTCRTTRIDLRPGGEWVFDMIGPDGTVFPNHHLYHEIIPHERFAYSLLWGENGPKHADAWASFEPTEGGTLVRLGMVFSSVAEFQTAEGFGASALGQQTLGKLERALLQP